MDSVEDFCIPMLSRNTMVKFLNVMGGLKEISLNRMVLNYEKKKDSTANFTSSLFVQIERS